MQHVGKHRQQHYREDNTATMTNDNTIMTTPTFKRLWIALLPPRHPPSPDGVSESEAGSSKTPVTTRVGRERGVKQHDDDDN